MRGVGEASGRAWRLFAPGATSVPESLAGERWGEAAWNMAVDETLLDSVSDGNGPCLRLYTWKRAAVTLGRFQDAARTLDLAACVSEDIPCVRRASGGRGVLHGPDLTLSVAATLGDLGFYGVSVGVLPMYRRLAAGLLRAFDEMGVGAAMGQGTRKHIAVGQGDCFRAVSAADIAREADGAKLLGAALHRRADVVLMQASLPLEAGPEWDRLRARVFGGGVEAPGLPGSGFEGWPEAVARGMASELCVVFAPAEVSGAEESLRVETLARARYVPVNGATA